VVSPTRVAVAGVRMDQRPSSNAGLRAPNAATDSPFG
jgi:hypothetical protein